MPVLAGFLHPTESLVALVGLRFRIRVEKRRKVVRLDSAPDHVVVLGSTGLDEPEFRTGEMDAVGALGDTGDLGVAVVRAAGRAAVIHQDFASVLDHREIGAGLALPGLVGGENDFTFYRLVQFQRDTVFLRDQVLVDEEFPAWPQIDRLGSLSDERKKQQERDRFHGWWA